MKVDGLRQFASQRRVGVTQISDRADSNLTRNVEVPRPNSGVSLMGQFKPKIWVILFMRSVPFTYII